MHGSSRIFSLLYSQSLFTRFSFLYESLSTFHSEHTSFYVHTFNNRFQRDSLLLLQQASLGFRETLLTGTSYCKLHIQLFRERLSDKSTRQSWKVVWVIISILFISISRSDDAAILQRRPAVLGNVDERVFRIQYSFRSGCSAYIAKNYSALCVKMP